jgi:hypothetical protein
VALALLANEIFDHTPVPELYEPWLAVDTKVVPVGTVGDLDTGDRARPPLVT